ncbi:uncharacterized protein LOC113203339 [Frankliniella occidentalis]|uniref:Uncharacterized protein LOC113203339 n=1 Tax=Frankliniella occidentalis TaxID=133901 RepID=A0A6J1S3J8_FRAOC|nr:uncharacterized protein LOC113203339 [Frankliniella occidentalis]
MFVAPAAFFETNLPSMTQSSLGSRKRGRSDADDESRDFTPLSKRINNLHINNGNYSNHSASTHDEIHTVSPAERGGPNTSDEGNNSQGVVQQPMYSPDMNVSDNPYYYEPNKLLYYLNIERMQRSGQSFG